MIIKQNTIKLAKDNGFEIKTTKMGLNRIAMIMVDDIKGLTIDKNIKRLIMINEIYLDVCNDGELGLSEKELNNKIEAAISEFLNNNSSVYFSSVDNTNVSLADVLSTVEYLNHQAFDNKTFLYAYNLVVNKDQTILNSSKSLEKSVKRKIIYEDSDERKSVLYLEKIADYKYYTPTVDKFVKLLKQKGLSIEEIRYLLEKNCNKDLVYAFNEREELRAKNKERSLYLKRKYAKKD